MRNVHVKWWHVVVGFFIVFVAIPYLLGSAWYLVKPNGDSTEVRFSDDEKAQLRSLQPELGSLVFSKAEVADLSRYFYDCTSPDINAGVDYDTTSDGSDVEGVRPTQLAAVPRGDSEFCNDADNSWLSFHASTEPTKSELMEDLEILADLSQGKEEDLDSVVLPLAEYHAPNGEVLEYGWLDTRGVGEASYGMEATISLRSGVYKVYRVTFIRGVIWAGLTARFPESAGGRGEAISLAKEFDEKIKLHIQAVVADSDAHPPRQSPSPTKRPSPTASSDFSGCLNERGAVELWGSASFTTRTKDAMEKLPEEYRDLVNCWLTFIVESSPATGRPFVQVWSGTYYETGEQAFANTDSEVAEIAYAASIVHEAVHVREYWRGRPADGRDGELTALRVQLEVLRGFPVPLELLGCLAELINNIDDPAYQYWNGATPPCKAIHFVPATPPPT